MEVELLWSLLTISWVFNSTTNNQGNHCIVAFDWPDNVGLVDQGNQQRQCNQEMIAPLLKGLAVLATNLG